MSDIEWTDTVWNPVLGCSRVSAGCQNCYAERFAHRGLTERHRGLTVMGSKGPRWTGEVRLVPEVLGTPLTWRKPRRVFVNSMSDLFHEGVSFEFIAAVFGVMAAAPQHTFQVLTKRPARMREFFEWLSPGARFLAFPPPPIDKLACLADDALTPHMSHADLSRAFAPGRGAKTWPLPNVWLGVSVEDQATADERIPLLLECPAAVRWVSAEPLLATVDLGLQSATCKCCPRWSSRWVRLPRDVRGDFLWAATRAPAGLYRASSNQHGALCVPATDGKNLGIKPAEFEALPGLDWVVVGGESGPGARTFDIAWARSIVQQCKTARVPCFVKQLGARPLAQHPMEPGALLAVSLADRKGGDMAEWSNDLRVRQWPGAVP